jgi:hypothetical protein
MEDFKGFQELTSDESMAVNGGLTLTWSEWGNIFSDMVPTIVTAIQDFTKTLFSAITLFVDTLASSLVSSVEAYRSISVTV